MDVSTVVIYALCVFIVVTFGRDLIYEMVYQTPFEFLNDKLGTTVMIVFAPITVAFLVAIIVISVCVIAAPVAYDFVTDDEFRSAVLRRK